MSCPLCNKIIWFWQSSDEYDLSTLGIGQNREPVKAHTSCIESKRLEIKTEERRIRRNEQTRERRKAKKEAEAKATENLEAPVIQTQGENSNGLNTETN